jgi:hypothetical protein
LKVETFAARCRKVSTGSPVSDTDLEREFELDPFWLLVNSNCGL